MRYIRKGSEPRSLLQHRLTAHATYDNLDKEEVRKRLASDQGFICCYCMQRISADADGMKIEHWGPQSASATSHLKLDWKNLLGACKGNEGKPWREQHCDTRKGETAITVNPTDPRCEQIVRFLADGTIESDDPVIQNDLNDTLNLNLALFKNNRRAVLDAFRQALERKNPGATWPKHALESELAELQQPDGNGMLQPFCQVPIYWLRKRIGRLGKSPP